MIDCTKKLHATLRNPAECAAILGDFVARCARALAGPGKAPGATHTQPRGALRADALPGWCAHRPAARRVLVKTAQSWSRA